jgi:hypothetical protein
MTKLPDAINLYNPNAQWVIDGDNYNTLQWHSDDIPKPTLKELETLIPQVESAKAEAQAAAEAKLAALGLTTEDLQALRL